MRIKEMPDPFCNIRHLVVLKEKDAVGAFDGNGNLVALLPITTGDSLIQGDIWQFKSRCELNISGHGLLGPTWDLVE